MRRACAVAGLTLLLHCSAPSPPPVTEVPSKKVFVDYEPLPYPPAEVLLTFQQGEPPEGTTFTRPLGDALLDDKQRVWLSFPAQNTLMAMAPPEWTPMFYGPASRGGHDEALYSPGLLSIRAGGIAAAGPGGKLTALREETVTTQSLDAVVLIPLRDGGAFGTRRGAPKTWLRFDAEGRTRTLQAELPPLLGTPVAEARTGAWVACDTATGRLLLFDAQDALQGILQLPPEIHGREARVTDLAREGNRIWLLSRKDHAARLLEVDTAGTVRAFRALPYRADGLALSRDYLLFFHRGEARAVLVRR